MKWNLRNEKGFTLIEVIVVAVIIAVISAVAIPLYNGYLKDSRIRTAENVAGSAASFLGTAYAQFGIQAGTIVKYRSGGATDWTALGDATSIGTVDDWTKLLSEGGKPAELGVFLATGDALNSFIIPTGIAIQIDGTAGTVKARHVASDPDDPKQVTQLYHFKTATPVAVP